MRRTYRVVVEVEAEDLGSAVALVRGAGRVIEALDWSDMPADGEDRSFTELPPRLVKRLGVEHWGDDPEETVAGEGADINPRDRRVPGADA